VFGFKEIERGDLLTALQLRRGGFGQREVMRGVQSLIARQFATGDFAQFFKRILMNGFEHDKARFAGGSFGLTHAVSLAHAICLAQKAVIHHDRQTVENRVFGIDRVCAKHGFG